MAPVARLIAESGERRKLAEERALAGPLVTHTYRLSYARAEQAVEVVKKFLSPRGQAFYDTRTNTLFVQDVE